jgi:hypothetical protein
LNIRGAAFYGLRIMSSNWRRGLAGVVTALAGLLMLLALLAPNDLNQYHLGAFLRIPVEGLVGVAIVLAVPRRARRVTAATLGVLLGVLTLLKVFDLGFFRVLYRPFDPVLDWTFLSAAVNFITATNGKFIAICAVVGVVLLAIGVPTLLAWSALRLTRVVDRHPTASVRTVTVLVVACFAVGTPLASTSAAQYAYLHAKQVPAGIADQREFAQEASVDAFRDTPSGELLNSLRGKDVMLTFIESYGRSAIEKPELAPETGAVLEDGTKRLRAKGFSAKSGFVTSPTYGGGSWLAHATLASGLWIDNQQRYRNLVSTDRLTLDRAFQRAGWRTVGVEPAVTQAWPEGAFFGYDQIYEAGDLGYRGPRFSYATMPDQYILSAFHRSEMAKPSHAPVMAQITTMSSHAPWSPVPSLVDWTAVGDGSVFATMAGSDAPPEAIFSRASPRVQDDYGRSIVYSLNNVISYVETYGDDNLVLVFLGDHQPAPVVTGEGAGHDVPITIVARDPAVFDKIASWGWTDGLKPDPHAPVWRMSEVRDRFLRAFS